MNKKNQTKQIVWLYTKVILGWGIFFYLACTQKGIYLRYVAIYIFIIIAYSLGKYIGEQQLARKLKELEKE